MIEEGVLFRDEDRKPRQASPPLLLGPSVVGRCQERWEAWREIGAPDMVVEWIRRGVGLYPDVETLRDQPRKGNKIKQGEEEMWTDKKSSG